MRRFITIAMTIGICLVAGAGASAQVVTPEQCLGFKPGADYHLATYEQAIGCYEKMASQTGRMKIFQAGTTAMGRPMKYAVVSSEANIARLDEWRDISKKLSLVHGVSETEAKALAERGKVVVWLDGGLHASECAPAQQMIQLAYDLVTGEDEKTRQIRDNVVALLVFPNPDGMTLLSEWYQGNVGTPFETSPMPWVYNKYGGHDNNRDAFYANMVETENMMRLQFHEWLPEIVLNQHQTAPFPARIFVPPYAEPTNPAVHPLIWRESSMIGSAMGWAFDRAGQTGVISRIAFDSFYPGYFTSIPDSHNCPGILTEIALFRYATPREYSVNEFPEAFQDLRPGRFYPTPWKGGWWRLGDATAYALTASKAVLDVASRYREDFLLNKYLMGRDAIASGQQKPPYGWIIPPGQRDPGAVTTMLNKLILLGTEIYTAEAPFDDGGKSYPAGTYLVPASQPFGPFVKEMFERQDYPDLRKYPQLWQNMVGQPVKAEDPLRPYDAAGWTLPLQFGVNYVEMTKAVDVKRAPVVEAKAPAGSVVGRGTQYVFSHDESDSFRAVNALLAAGAKVGWARESFSFEGKTYPRGAYLVDGGSIPAAKLGEIAAKSRVVMTGVKSAAVQALRPLRLGLYKSWVASMDEGWTRLILEQFGFPYSTVSDADIRAGALNARFDVIMLPDQDPESIIDGHAAGVVPQKYAGGITAAGVQNLRQFVEAGGVLIANGNASTLAIDQFKLPVTNVVKGANPREFFIPGSILKMDYDTTQPIAFGMPDRGVAFFARSLVFKVGSAAAGSVPTVVARYPREPLLLSGWALGDDRIQGEGSVVSVPLGKGRVVLFGFGVINRWQTPAVLPLLFNALYDRP